MSTTDSPSLARGFFERILAASDRAAFLARLVNSTPLTYETEWLEFKSYPHEKTEQEIDHKIKELWCKNIAGFANTQGGVVVWGIGARKRNKVDAATKLELVPCPDALRTRLFELHHEATDPPLSGVEIVAVPFPDERSKGCVACYIPQGRFPPYRAEFHVRNYYIRVGDDTVIPSPVILRSLFFPRSLARIETNVVLSCSRKECDRRERELWRYQVFLKNTGQATAHDVYLLIKDNVPYNASLGAGVYHAENWHLRTGSPNESGVLCLIPVHPGFTTQVASSYGWDPASHSVQNGVIYPAFPTLRIRLIVYSRDFEHQDFEVEFTREDFVARDRCEKECCVTVDHRSD